VGGGRVRSGPLEGSQGEEGEGKLIVEEGDLELVLGCPEVRDGLRGRRDRSLVVAGLPVSDGKGLEVCGPAPIVKGIDLGARLLEKRECTPGLAFAGVDHRKSDQGADFEVRLDRRAATGDLEDGPQERPRFVCGTARSSALAGRSRIETASTMPSRPCPPRLAFLLLRMVRRQRR
jgi:hypothetical protein